MAKAAQVELFKINVALNSSQLPRGLHGPNGSVKAPIGSLRVKMRAKFGQMGSEVSNFDQIGTLKLLPEVRGTEMDLLELERS